MAIRTIIVPSFTPPKPRVRGYSRSLYYHKPGELAATLALDYYITHHGPAPRLLIEKLASYSAAVEIVRSAGGRGGEPRAQAAALLYYTLRTLGSSTSWKEIYRGMGVPKQTAYTALQRFTEALGHMPGFHRLIHLVEPAGYKWTSQGRILLPRAPAILVVRDGPWVAWERLVWGRTVRPPGWAVGVEVYGLP
ncbi:MAG: hypothetical protein GSR84_02985 [Desulfurococcales archaeon]|nr:hypothetical protein [Desulfurococcales archaeon]